MIEYGLKVNKNSEVVCINAESGGRTAMDDGRRYIGKVYSSIASNGCGFDSHCGWKVESENLNVTIRTIN